MSFIKKKADWDTINENHITPESVYLNRRRFLKAMGVGTISAGLLATGFHSQLYADPGVPGTAFEGIKRNPLFDNVGRDMTREDLVLGYNNFYEFSTHKRLVAGLAKDFKLDPYTLSIEGLVDKPITLGIEDIEKMGLEERVYRFRCVEAWAMTVPWIGLPLHKILKKAGVKKQAKYIRMISFHDPKQAPGQEDKQYKWPYYEALSIPEAMNDLCFVALGLYGKRLAPQSGTPLRIVVPWKYGYKGPKSVVKIIVTDKKPNTFWHDLYPKEYSFVSNVDPTVPHPRWSQATERLLNTGDRVPTLAYNGYGAQVADIYK